MPVKTGQQLLEHVRRQEDTRFMPFIMLTARADKESVINAAMCGVTDYIHKPFNREDLIDKVSKIINRDAAPAKAEAKSATASNTGNASADPQRREIIDLILEKLRKDDFSLPSSPEIIYSALDLINSPDSSVSDVADIIKKDALCTTRLIAISNCGIYRGSRNNNTLEEAISRLGLKETSNFLWLIANGPLFVSNNEVFQELLSGVKQHSLAAAESAQMIAKRLKLSNPTEFYYMGLLHDVGSVLVLQILEELDKQQPIGDHGTIIKAVQQLHPQFGEVLLKRWNLPDRIINIAKLHDTPEIYEPLLTELRVVNVACFVARKLGFDVKDAHNDEREDSAADADNIDQAILELPSAQSLKLNQELINELKERIPEYMQVMKNLL